VWHVKRAWLKHLLKKVSDWDTRNKMMNELCAVLELKDTNAAKAAADAFIERWVCNRRNFSYKKKIEKKIGGGLHPHI
jgi:hypothetical protein